MAEYYEARVLFDYDPATSDELCLRVGETVEVRLGSGGGGGEEEEEGWLYGSDLRGRHGTFPANYVADLRRSEEYNGGGGASSSAPSFHRPGDDVAAEQAGVGGASTAAISVDGAKTVTGESGHREGGMPAATSGYAEHDSNGAPYYSTHDAAAGSVSSSFGEQGAGNTYGETAPVAAANTQDEYYTISESVPTTTNPQPEPATTQHAALASGAEPGAASGQLPDGWLCGVDENSGVMYYYTADGKSSSWTRPTAAAADALSETASGDRKESYGLASSTDPSPTSVSAGVKEVQYVLR